MKKIAKILVFSSILISSLANAEEFIRLEDNSKILGSWLVTAEAAALHKEKKETNNVWTFGNDGFMSAKSHDRRFSSRNGNAIKVTYEVADGVIRKQFQPGRSKTEDCKVVKLKGREMILHCAFNYFFLTKQ